MNEADILNTVAGLKDLLSNPFYDFSDHTAKGTVYKDALLSAIECCEELIKLKKTKEDD